MKVGDKVRIIRMEGEPLYSERTGVVEYIDDAGQLHGTWGGLAIQPSRDECEVIADGDGDA